MSDPYEITPAVYQRAIARGAREAARQPTVQHFCYLPERQAFRFELADGSAVEVPVAHYPELAQLSEEERVQVELFGRVGLMHEASDLHVHLAGLWADSPELLKLAQWVGAAHRGRSRSVAKTDAARTNGRKGGRPKRLPTPQA